MMKVKSLMKVYNRKYVYLVSMFDVCACAYVYVYMCVS